MPENGRSPTDDSGNPEEAGDRVADQGPDAVADAARALSGEVDAAPGTDSPDDRDNSGEQASVATNGAATGMPVAAGARRSRLRDAMRRARQNDAERNDVIVDLREMEVARLEVLAESVRDVFDELPDSTDLFDGQVSRGEPPRLWIDVLAYVTMGRDRRTYQFVQETRQGRKVINKTRSVDQMGERITNYIAHRMIERERALLSESVSEAEPSGSVGEAPSDRDTLDGGNAEMRGQEDPNAGAPPDATSALADGGSSAPAAMASDLLANPPESRGPRYSGLAMIVSFLLGMVAGAIMLFLIGANYTPPAG